MLERGGGEVTNEVEAKKRRGGQNQRGVGRNYIFSYNYYYNKVTDRWFQRFHFKEKYLPTAVEVIGGGELLWPDIRCVSTNLACCSLTTLSKITRYQLTKIYQLHFSLKTVHIILIKCYINYINIFYY